MAYNPPRQPAADPWGASFSSTTSAVPGGCQRGYSSGGATQPQTSAPQWGSSGAAPSAAWPSNTPAPQWPSSAPQWPASAPSTGASAWNQNTSTTTARGWPESSPPGVSAQPSAWGSTSAMNTSLNTSTASAWPSTSAAPQSAWPSTSGSANPWPSSTAAANDPWGGPANVSTSSAWGNTSALNQSTGSAWSTAGAGPTRQPLQSHQSGSYYGNTSGIADPFGGPTNTSTMMNTSYQSTASFNPFDVTNDDAGFFASAPKPANNASSKPPASTPKDNVPPPSATTQRLLRVASMLFERGSLIKADKLFIQDLVLRGDKKAEKVLENFERDGKVEEVHALIRTERKRESKRQAGETSSDSEDDDVRAEAAQKVFKKRQSVARKNSDDDDDQTETLTDFRRQSSAPGKSGGVEAPHPSAGGYTGTIPADMSVQKGQFVGQILMRISSKKMFRKWKPVFFALDLPRLTIYENRREWEMGAAPKFVLPLHECMWIAKPTLKKTYSLIDDGRRVYYSTLKENSPSVVASATMAGMERPVTFSSVIESRVVAKFGSYYPDEISAFAHAIYSVVLSHQRDVKASLASSGGSSRRF